MRKWLYELWGGEDWVNYDGEDKIQKVTLISLLFIKLGKLNAMTLINIQMKE